MQRPPVKLRVKFDPSAHVWRESTQLRNAVSEKSGLVLSVDIHVVVDGEISVNRGHQIAHDVKDALLRSDLSILDAVVHIEPGSLERLT